MKYKHSKKESLEVDELIRTGELHAETIVLNQAIAIFEDHLPEIIDAVGDNIAEDISKEQEKDIEVLSLLDRKNKMEMYIFQELQKISFQSLFSERTKNLKRIISALKHKNSSPPKGGVTQNMIDRAKESPIQDSFIGKLRKSGGLYIGKCPFHSEKTGSFIVKNNRFTCYGCHEYGDAIDFYMKYNNVDFISAVKELSK